MNPTTIIFSFIFFLLAAWLPAGQAAGEYQVSERGPHHRVWSRATSMTTPAGRVVWQTNRYVELKTSMHYTAEDGTLRESREEIEVIDGYGVARQGPHKARFAPNLRTRGGAEFWDAQGRRFASHPLMIAYEDVASGEAVVIAETKDCLGEVVGGSQVVYWDAFAGCSAAVRYRYTLEGIEQDIIFLKDDVPPPGEYGLEEGRVRLAVYTEFMELPPFSREVAVLEREPDEQRRGRLADPDLIDERLTFQSLGMDRGSVFRLGTGPEDPEALVTGKTLEVREGRRVLVERIDFKKLKPHLKGLPQAGIGQGKRAARTARVIRRQDRLLAGALPAPPPAEPAPGQSLRKLGQLAQATRPQEGLVWDFLLHAASLTNFTFQSDTTYFVNGSVALYGTTVIEPGTVVKYTNYSPANTYVRLLFYGPVDCRTVPHAPAIFTSKDDNSVGSVIAESTGVPWTNYAYQALRFYKAGVDYEVHDVQIRHAATAVHADSLTTQVRLSHAQIGKSEYAIYASTNISVRNALIYDCKYAFQASSTTNAVRTGENLTLHRNAYLAPGDRNIYLTNCLVVAVTNNAQYLKGTNNVVLAQDTGVFQTVESGSRYLANSSPYREAGTTNIHPELLEALSKRTTYPPVWLTNGIATGTVLGPQAPRGGGVPALGYHYAPLDYLAQTVVSNATVVLTNGVKIGLFDYYAFCLSDGGRLVSRGNVQDPNQFAWARAVQEFSTVRTNPPGEVALVWSAWERGPAPSLEVGWSEFSLAGHQGAAGYLVTGSGAGFSNLVARDCRFRGGYVELDGEAAPGAYGLTNNVFERVCLNLGSVARMHLHNNLFRDGSGFLGPQGTNAIWTFKDNLLDTCGLNNNGGPFLAGTIQLNTHNSPHFAGSGLQ